VSASDPRAGLPGAPATTRPAPPRPGPPRTNPDVDGARAASERVHRGEAVVFDGHSRFVAWDAAGYFAAWRRWSYGVTAAGALGGANIAQVVLLADPVLRWTAAVLVLLNTYTLFELHRRAPTWDAFVRRAG
jgi:hypothetical protein